MECQEGIFVEHSGTGRKIEKSESGWWSVNIILLMEKYLKNEVEGRVRMGQEMVPGDHSKKRSEKNSVNIMLLMGRYLENTVNEKCEKGLESGRVNRMMSKGRYLENKGKMLQGGGGRISFMRAAHLRKNAS